MIGIKCQSNNVLHAVRLASTMNEWKEGGLSLSASIAYVWLIHPAFVHQHYLYLPSGHSHDAMGNEDGIMEMVHFYI